MKVTSDDRLHEIPLETQASDDPEALFKEARQRRRRRWLWTGAVVLVAVALVALGVTLSSGGGRPAPTSKATSSQPQVSAVPRFTVQSIDLKGFAPEHVFSQGGKVWLIGPSNPEGFTNCKIESVNPATLRRHLYPLAACGDYITTDGGAIYLTAISYEHGTNNEQVRIERFDPATGHSTVIAAVIMTLVGSAQAHVAFAYADGSLWFRGYGSPGTPSDDLVQVSPSTGTVVRTVPDSTSPLLTDEPSLLGNGTTLWLASGPGSSAAIATLAPGQSVPTQVYAESASGNVVWLASVHGNVWADVTTNNIPHLVEFSPSGAVLLRTGPLLLGNAPLVSTGSTLWTSGVVGNCNSPIQVLQVNGSTGRTTPAVTVHTSSNPCVVASGLASAGRFVFQLIGWPATPARLYRIGARQGGQT